MQRPQQHTAAPAVSAHVPQEHIGTLHGRTRRAAGLHTPGDRTHARDVRARAATWPVASGGGLSVASLAADDRRMRPLLYHHTPALGLASNGTTLLAIATSSVRNSFRLPPCHLPCHAAGVPRELFEAEGEAREERYHPHGRCHRHGRLHQVLGRREPADE